MGHGIAAYHARDLQPSVLAVPRLLPTIEAPFLTMNSRLWCALPMAAVCIAAQDLGRAVGVGQGECHCNLQQVACDQGPAEELKAPFPGDRRSCT